MNYVGIPLKYEEEQLTLVRSIEGRIRMLDNLVELIVFTPRGTFEADPDFGFEYWNHEFSNVHYREFNLDQVGKSNITGFQNEVTRKECEESIRNSLATYEPMLKNVVVSIELDLPEEKRRYRKVSSKYKVNVVVSGDIDDGLGTLSPYSKSVLFLIEPTVKRNL